MSNPSGVALGSLLKWHPRRHCPSQPISARTPASDPGKIHFCPVNHAVVAKGEGTSPGDILALRHHLTGGVGHASRRKMVPADKMGPYGRFWFSQLNTRRLFGTVPSEEPGRVETFLDRMGPPPRTSMGSVARRSAPSPLTQPSRAAASNTNNHIRAFSSTQTRPRPG